MWKNQAERCSDYPHKYFPTYSCHFMSHRRKIWGTHPHSTIWQSKSSYHPLSSPTKWDDILQKFCCCCCLQWYNVSLAEWICLYVLPIIIIEPSKKRKIFIDWQRTSYSSDDFLLCYVLGLVLLCYMNGSVVFWYILYKVYVLRSYVYSISFGMTFNFSVCCPLGLYEMFQRKAGRRKLSTNFLLLL